MKFEEIIKRIENLLDVLEQKFQCSYEFSYVTSGDKRGFSTIFQSRIEAVDLFERQKTVLKILKLINKIDQESVIFLRFCAPQLGFVKNINGMIPKSDNKSIENILNHSDTDTYYEEDRPLDNMYDEMIDEYESDHTDSISNYHKSLLDKFIEDIQLTFTSFDKISKDCKDNHDIAELINIHMRKFERANIPESTVKNYLRKHGIIIGRSDNDSYK